MPWIGRREAMGKSREGCTCPSLSLLVLGRREGMGEGYTPVLLCPGWGEGRGGVGRGTSVPVCPVWVGKGEGRGMGREGEGKEGYPGWGWGGLNYVCWSLFQCCQYGYGGHGCGEYRRYGGYRR